MSSGVAAGVGSSSSSPRGTRSGRTSQGNDRRGDALEEYRRDRDEGAAADADAGGFDGPVEATLTDEDLPGSMGVEDLSPALDRETLAAASEADDAAEFAEAVFGEESRAPRVGDPEAPARRAYPPPEPGQGDRYGGFPEYGPDRVDDWHQLGDPLAEEDGVRDEFMERGDTSAAPFDADEVYACQYCADTVGPDHPAADRLVAFEDEDPPLSGDLDAPREARHNEMAQYATYDALGMDVPRHTYDAETDRLIAEGAGRGVEMTEVALADENTLDGVDRQEVVDKLAVAALLGNGDMHGGNVGVDEDGNFHTFDLDRGARRVRDPVALRGYAQSRAASTFDFDTPVTDAEVSARATEIATAAVVSGQADAVGESVAAYDDLFERIDPQVDDVSKADVVEGNLRAIAREAGGIHEHLSTRDLKAADRL